jgi:hypothetical protein
VKGVDVESPGSQDRSAGYGKSGSFRCPHKLKQGGRLDKSGQGSEKRKTERGGSQPSSEELLLSRSGAAMRQQRQRRATVGTRRCSLSSRTLRSRRTPGWLGSWKRNKHIKRNIWKYSSIVNVGSKSSDRMQLAEGQAAAVDLWKELRWTSF